MKALDPAVRPSRPEFDVHLTENVVVAMRDGVRLATDVYRPARDGRPLAEPRPVLLHRTPYNKTKTESAFGECRRFATRGYVVVNQDCRGCFHSEGSSSTTYSFDPANPVPSIGGNVSSLCYVLALPAGIADPRYAGRNERTADIVAPGGFDQREGPAFHGCRPPYLPLGSRPDVLVFETAPLEVPTEVTGPIEVVLWVATSAADTDFTAKLVDVYPPSFWYPLGYALNLTDSIARLRYRNGRERGEPAAPGVPMQLTITLYPTSNLFMPGHRIRLDISSSNHPRFDVNPNTGEPIGRDRRRVVADNTVFHERGRESMIVLPIIPLELLHP